MAYGLAIVVGMALVYVARWAHRRDATFEHWIAIRVGDVLVTEVAGAFLIGAGLGGLIALQLAFSSGGSQGGVVFISRFGGGGWGQLPVVGGGIGAATAILTRMDLSEVFARGSPPNSAPKFLGREARVIGRIPAGGEGEVAVRDDSGTLVVARATAENEITEGTSVHVIDIQGRTFVVAPNLPSSPVGMG
jgi:membrane protein implicated in regulation of membrane protease activity